MEFCAIELILVEVSVQHFGLNRVTLHKYSGLDRFMLNRVLPDCTKLLMTELYMHNLMYFNLKYESKIRIESITITRMFHNLIVFVFYRSNHF